MKCIKDPSVRIRKKSVIRCIIGKSIKLTFYSKLQTYDLSCVSQVRAQQQTIRTR